MGRAEDTNVVVITGASGGLGGAIARVYAAPGRVLGLVGRDEQRLKVVSQACRAAGALVETGSLDVTDAGAMADWLRAFDDRHAVDLVIANAGISSSNAPDGTVESPEVAAQTIAVNLIGVVNTVGPLIPAMRLRRRGQVAMIASLAALYPLPSTPGYNASKAGVVAYGRSLADALSKDGLRISVVCPGFVDTPMSARVNGRKPLQISAEAAAQRLVEGLARGRRTIVFPYPLAAGMQVLRLLPSRLANRLVRPFLYTVVPYGDQAESGSGGNQ